MSLVPCRECGQQVSTEARVCPHCGIESPAGSKQPVGLRTSNTTSLATILIVLFFLGFVAGQFGGVILLFVSLFAFIAFGIGVYFLPTFIAVNREHPDRYAIFIINLFFGWTFLGWIACLAWSVMDRRR